MLRCRMQLTPALPTGAFPVWCGPCLSDATHGLAIPSLSLQELGVPPISLAYLSGAALCCLPATWWHSRKLAVATLNLAGNALCASRDHLTCGGSFICMIRNSCGSPPASPSMPSLAYTTCTQCSIFTDTLHSLRDTPQIPGRAACSQEKGD